MEAAVNISEKLLEFVTAFYITVEAFFIAPVLTLIYVCFVPAVCAGLLELQPSKMTSASPFTLLNVFLYVTIFFGRVAYGQGVDPAPFTTTAQELSTAGPSITVAPSGTNTRVFEPRFTVPAEADVGAVLIPNVADPQAVDVQSVCPGYKGSNVVRTQNGLTATLTLAGEACNVYGNDVDVLNLTVEYQAKDRLWVNIIPAYLDASNTSYYILPENLVARPTADPNGSSDNDMAFYWSNDPSFCFSVIRQSTGDVLFSTMGTKIVYEDQFIEFASALPENYNLYGLGEVIHGFRLGNNLTRTLYAADVGDPIDENIYGTHPLYVDTRYYEMDESTGNLTLVTSNETDSSSDYVSYSHGLYNRNAHGQEILLRASNITWRALGGSIDLYFYAGPTVNDITASLQTSTIGLPAMQQYFTFGFHQCRWGYQNWTVLQEIVDNFAKFGIPLDNIWTDIDYMNQYRNFDHDQNTYSYDEGEEFLSKLSANGQHYIPIIDSAIYHPNPENASDAYETFNRGNDSDAFLLNPDGSLYIGTVWPGYTVFPDWLPESGGEDWWVDEVQRYHTLVNFSGIWIDMSEASSFCIGSCGSNNISLNPVHPPFALPGEPGNRIYDYPEGFNLTNATEAAAASSASAAQSSSSAAAAGPTPTESPVYLRTTPTPGARNIEHPPYVIDNVQGDLSVHAVSPNATHHDGTLEYDVHNIWGYGILRATYNALLQVFPGKRPFIIGRSTFPGAGTVAGHWGGDNASKWYYMYFSIPQALSFSLFGIPMFGADTCGFNGNTDEELCSRWMQLSAFFPFYRNHNTLTANAQEPYVWASVAEATRNAMDIRFQLLPYMYTLFHLAHTTGSTVMRALAWEFPHDPALANADRQFFLGPAVLVTPVLTQGAANVSGVFPGAGKGEVYYDWYTRAAVNVSAGQNLTLDAPLGHIPVHVRGGHVIATQEMAMTTRAARSTPWSMLVALSLEGTASGSLYVDDGESVEPDSTLVMDFSATGSALYASGRGTYEDTNPLANVTVMGVVEAPGSVTLNGVQVGSDKVSYDESTGCLKIAGMQNNTSGGAWASDWVLRWS